MKKIRINKAPLILSVFRPNLNEYSKALTSYHKEISTTGESSDMVHKRLDDYFSFHGRYCSVGDKLFFKKISEKEYDNLEWHDDLYLEIEAVLLMPQKLSELGDCNFQGSRQIKVYGTGGILKLDDKIVQEERSGRLVYKKQSSWENFWILFNENSSSKERDRMGNPFKLTGYEIAHENYPSTFRILTRER